MTTGLSLFLAFYLFVGQPILLGWLQSDTMFYQLAGFNAGVFFIALIVAFMCRNCKKNKSCEECTCKEKVKGKEKNIVEEKKEGKVEDEKNIEELVEEKEKNTVEEKKEELKEKVIKESVSIPKIVQPLSSHQTSKRRKKESRIGQWIILLITLLVAGVLAFALWEFLGTWGIAVSLFIGWILYLLIGKVMDVNGFYKARTLFTNRLYVVLILVGIGYGVYVMQQSDKEFNFFPEGRTDKIIVEVRDWFQKDDGNKVELGEGSGNIYVFEGTGEVIDEPVLENEDVNVENSGENTELIGDDVNTGDVNNQEVEPEIVESVKDEATLNQNVTMGDAIKYLLAGTKLSTSTKTTFKNISKTSELYPYFKTAQEKGMVGTDVDPNKIVGCETYITMKGLLEGWNVGKYVKSEIKTAYWNKAQELGELNGCVKGAYLKVGNL